MATQTISKTFIGTSDPKTLEYSLSYYGPKGPDADKTTIGKSMIFFDRSKKVGPQKASAKLSANLTLGLALPSWAVSATVDEGKITDDAMELSLTEDTAMGGMFCGALFDLNFVFDTETWIPGYLWHKGWRPHWVSAHWHDDFNKSLNFPIDLIPTCVDLLYSLAKLVPGFKKLVAIFPKGLLDHMQDYENGLATSEGLFLDPKIPMKWDLIFIARQVAEVAADLGSNVLTPAAAAIVTALTTFAEAMVSLEEDAGVCIGSGPEITLVFPLHVKITGLVADDVTFGTLAFDGNKITGTNPDSSLDIANTPVQRIGFQCEQTLDLMELTLGWWSSVTFQKVFKLAGSRDFNLVQLIEEHAGLDLGFGSFKSTMTNEIGQPGYDNYGNPPESIDVRFI